MQQPISKTINTLPAYNTVFSQNVIPTDMTGQHYPHAQTTVFDNTFKVDPEDIIIIDSRYRNWDTESPSNYTCYLGQKFDYVQSIELVDGYVITSNYVIGQDNNMLAFIEKSQVIEITIPEGIYSIDQLCQVISTLMTDASTHDYEYICERNPQLDQIIIRTKHHHVFDLIWSDGNEVIEDNGLMDIVVNDPTTHKKITQRVAAGKRRQSYRPNSIGPILGYKPINLCGTYSYIGQNIYNLYPDDYLALHLTNDTHDDFSNIYAQTNAQGARGAFAILDLSTSLSRPLGTANRQYTSRRRFIKKFDPPIRLTKLRVEIKKPNGNYYDFHGLDHYLFLIIRRDYNRQYDKT